MGLSPAHFIDPKVGGKLQPRQSYSVDKDEGADSLNYESWPDVRHKTIAVFFPVFLSLSAKRSWHSLWRVWSSLNLDIALQIAAVQVGGPTGVPLTQLTLLIESLVIIRHRDHPLPLYERWWISAESDASNRSSFPDWNPYRVYNPSIHVGENVC